MFNVTGLLAQIHRPRPTVTESGWAGWLSDSRNGVFLVLGLAIFLGGGRKLLSAMRARRAVDELAGDKPSLAAIAEAAKHGRSAVVELFRLLGSSTDRAVKDAAGRALAVLWKQDELIAEEEQAVVTRGFVVNWKARRKYPRALDRPFPVVVEFGVPFLDREGEGVGPDHLEWSWRILGADRASLETPSPWIAGAGRAEFAIDPRDFRSNGPHRLVLHARVRTKGLTSEWERELPLVPFTFEFDPNLSLDALFTLPDAEREAAIVSAIRLETEAHAEAEFLPLGPEFALREPPVLRIRGPLPCDLAHDFSLESDGSPHLLPVGEAVVVGRDVDGEGVKIRCREMPPAIGEWVDGPGETSVRGILRPDSRRAWADPEIRTVWPGEIVTDWVTVRVVRR